MSRTAPTKPPFTTLVLAPTAPCAVGWCGGLQAAIESISGSGVPGKVAEAYKYLMDHYEPGGRVFLFGYSRGAHTVRDLAGLLDSCGLPTKGSNNLIPYAMDFYYRRDDAEERQFANRFQRTFVRTCNPYLIGVWDTVASVGWLWWRRYFRNATLARSVPFAYQALAVDGRRAHYRPSRWNEDAKPDGQTIEQVWFPGYHGAVGGQMADNRISDIPSMWVLASAEERGLRLKTSWEAV